MTGRWSVTHHALDAASFHALDPSTAGAPLWVARPIRPALVLGSTQPDRLVDRAAAARAGVDVVRRRSGGGIVFVDPATTCWVDFVIRPGDPLWDDDVGASMFWVGDRWHRALASLGVTSTVHRGRPQHTEWSETVCFAGVGPGELVGPGGRKVVGVSQRRTHDWARFQTAALTAWDPSPLLQLLAPPWPHDPERLASVATGTGVEPTDLLVALKGTIGGFE